MSTDVASRQAQPSQSGATAVVSILQVDTRQTKTIIYILLIYIAEGWCSNPLCVQCGWFSCSVGRGWVRGASDLRSQGRGRQRADAYRASGWIYPPKPSPRHPRSNPVWIHDTCWWEYMYGTGHSVIMAWRNTVYAPSPTRQRQCMSSSLPSLTCPIVL